MWVLCHSLLLSSGWQWSRVMETVRQKPRKAALLRLPCKGAAALPQRNSYASPIYCIKPMEIQRKFDKRQPGSREEDV